MKKLFLAVFFTFGFLAAQPQFSYTIINTFFTNDGFENVSILVNDLDGNRLAGMTLYLDKRIAEDPHQLEKAIQEELAARGILNKTLKLKLKRKAKKSLILGDK